MTLEYDISNNYSIYNFVKINNNKITICQNFGEPGIIFNFKKEIIETSVENNNKLIILIEANRPIYISGNCINGKNKIDSGKEIEILLEIKNKNNSFKLYIEDPELLDWFLIKKIKIFSTKEIIFEKNEINKLIFETNEKKVEEKKVEVKKVEEKKVEEKKVEEKKVDVKKVEVKKIEEKKVDVKKVDVKKVEVKKIEEKKVDVKKVEVKKIEEKKVEEKNIDTKLKFRNIFINKYKTEREIDLNIFNNKGINQIYISESLKNFSRIKELYNLKEYNNTKESCLFFGIYNNIDIEILQNHIGKKYVMYGGTDCDFRFGERLKNFDIIKKLEVNFISISENIQERLKKRGIESEIIKLDLVDYNKFKVGEIGNKIYVYLGNKNIEKEDIGTEKDIYGYKEYIEIKGRFPEFEFIESNNLNKRQEEMSEIYKECFIGLRLTKYDGNANTVREMGAMGIPVVHNGTLKNSLNWKSIDDIELHIKYTWIEKIMQELSEYKKILFMSTDYPNYGGIATNTVKLIKFFESVGHNVYGFYHCENPPNHGMYDKNIYVSENLKKGINRVKSYFEGDPDLIIIRNYTDINIIRTRFTSKLYFFIPGFFTPNVKNNLDEIKNKKEIDAITHPKILNCIEKSDRIFTNNSKTLLLLKKYHGIKTEIFYFMDVPFYPNLYKIDEKLENRKYDIGVVISDYTRSIKNINEIRRILEKNKEKNKIIIGKNSNILGDIPNTEIHDLLPNNIVIEKMKEIKYIINESFVENTNNTIIEAKHSGCKIYENNMSEISILIVSTQYPNYGGGATLAYKFHQYLIKNKINSYCLFLDKNVKLKNPNNIKNVEMYDYLSEDNTEIIKKNIEKEIGDPDLIIGFNYVAPYVIKKIFTSSKIAYYLTGSKYMSENGGDVVDFINRKDKNINEIVEEELKTIKISDYVIPNSYITETLYSEIYGNYLNKLERIMTLENLFYEKIEKEIEEKTYDILVVASRYDRKVKNIDFVKELYESEELKDYKKCCIGKFSEKYISKENNITHLGFLDDKKIDEIMQKSKILIIASKYESMSITLIKGIKNKNIIITNENVGASYLVDKHLIMRNFNKNEWINKITTILNNYNYYKKIIKYNLEYINNNYIENLKRIINKEKKNDKHILICSIDTPYIGGSATNAYNMIKELRNKKYKVSGLFISGTESILDPDKIGNIYFSKMDENIEINTINKINEIIKENTNINIILVKNYKCFCIINFIIKKYFKNNIPIIFSPSGSKYITDMRDLEKIDKIDIDYEFINNLNNVELYELITKYDENIEMYVMNMAENILPNSKLTYNILKKVYNNEINLSFPINITYIDFKNNNLNLEREYDIGFICYSWKRKIKGGEIMRNIIKKIDPKLKILVVGLNSGIKSTDQITVRDNLDHEELLKYMNKTKIICFTSLYDSSPNVLKEAISCGCKIILTENIGNSELIEKEYVINLEDYNLWNEKIKKLLTTTNQNINKELVYGNISEEIINYIESCLKNKNQEKESVGIYKVPAEWDTEHLGNFDEYLKENINLNLINIKNYNIIKKEIENNLKSDIYFDMYIKESYKRNINKMNWIIVSKDFYRNTKINLNNIRPYENKEITIWLINNCHDLFYFKNKFFYFVRGNYYNLYNKLINNNECILYPATALVYNQNYELQIQKVINYNFKKILYDEPKNKELWQQMFPKSEVAHFIKKPPEEFVYLNKIRVYQIIFVASENQVTKNHTLFIDMLKYYDNLGYKLDVIYVGNLSEINNLKLTNINLTIKFWIDHNELINLYNQSKINILFSGRDALPRVLIESLACGCFNIALDTISDGKYLLENELGIILSFDAEKMYDKLKKSISYKSYNKIFDKIYEYIKQEYNHEEISIKFKNLV
jgi:hypothetical protein